MFIGHQELEEIMEMQRTLSSTFPKNVFSTHTQTALKHLLPPNRVLAVIVRFKTLTQLGKQV